jgi:mycoredoxin
MSRPTTEDVIMYGTNWCPDCIRAKWVLRKLGVSYSFINTDKDSEAEKLVIEVNQGTRVIPTIFFPDGSTLVEPSNDALTTRVLDLGLATKI